MFSEELNKLIEAAFVDGVLTDKEKAIIMKHAIAEGVDPDEMEMILDAEVQKHLSSMNESGSNKSINLLIDEIGRIETKYKVLFRAACNHMGREFLWRSKIFYHQSQR